MAIILDYTIIRGGASSVTTLKQVSVTNLNTGVLIVETSTDSLYEYDKESALPGNDDTVVQPASGVGRWLKIGGFGVMLKLQDDTNPTLGGNLNVNGFSIVSSTNGDIVLSPNGTGLVKLSGISYPSTVAANNLIYADSSSSIQGLPSVADSTLVTDGTGAISWGSTLPLAVQSNITRLSTVSVGTWEADKVDIPHGGTNADNAVNALANLGGLPLAGGTMTGNLILNADPTLLMQATTKNYVDDLYNNGIVLPAEAASTADLNATYNNGAAGVGATLTCNVNGALVVDGYSPAVSELILVPNQTNAAENGYYVVTTVGDAGNPFVLTRSTEYDQPSDVLPGDRFVVQHGTLYEATQWVQFNTVTTIGTDPIDIEIPNILITAIDTLTGGLSTPTFLTMANAGSIRTTTSAGNTLLLQGYNTGTSTYSTVATITAGATPSFDLMGTTTIGSAYIYRVGGTDVAVGDGGTGLSSTPTNGQLLIGNGTNYTLAAITGTNDQITVTNGAGSITLGTPQSIATTSTPTFAGLTLTGTFNGTSEILTTTSNDAVGSYQYFQKSRAGANTQTGDSIGIMDFYGRLSGNYSRTGFILNVQDGAVGTYVPGKFQLATTNASAGSTLALEIDSNQKTQFYNFVGVGVYPTEEFHVRFDQNSMTTLLCQNNTSGTAAGASHRSTSASNQIEVMALSAGYTTSGPFMANSCVLRGTGTAGLNIVGTNGPIGFYNGASNTQVGSWSSVGLLNLMKSTAPTTNNLANEYMHVGGAEIGTNTYRVIGFGYNGGTYSPAYVGYSQGSAAGFTLGDVAIATRSVTTDTAPTERLIINIYGWANHTEADTAPTFSPASGFYFYSESGYAKIRTNNNLICPISYNRNAYVNSSGTLVTTSFNPSLYQGLSVSKTGTGIYVITFNGGVALPYIPAPKPVADSVGVSVAVTNATTSSCQVETFTSSTGANVDCGFYISLTM